MVKAASQYSVDVFDQREVTFVQRVFLRFMSVVQCHFLTVIDESRMLESKFSFEPSFVCNVFPKRWCESAHHAGGDLHDEAHKEEAFAADAAGERVVVDSHVEDWLRNVGVHFGERVGKFGDIDGDELIGVLYSVVESGKRVEGHLRVVFVVNVVGKSTTVLQGELALMVREHGIGEGRWDCDNHPPYQT